VQAGSLYKGIELPRVKHDTQNYRVAIIGGGRDPLTQPEMWTREQEENPHNVDLKIIPDRGHGMAVDSVGAAVQVDRTLQRIGVAA
jgi:pimeloyl-ACP methyl ester carboxylesterase